MAPPRWHGRERVRERHGPAGGTAVAPRPIALAALIAVALAILATAVLAAVGWPADRYRDGDFIQYWIAGNALVSGRDVYDPGVWRALHDALGSRGGEIVPGFGFLYPLTTAVAALPFAALPLPVAAPAWFVAQSATTLAALVALGRRLFVSVGRDLAIVLALAVVMQPSYVLAGDGNVARFLPAIAGAALALLIAGHPLAAGAALGLAIVKPQLFLLFVPALLLFVGPRNAARLALGGALVSGGLLLISVALRPDWIASWLSQASGVQGTYGRTNLWGALPPEGRWLGWPIALLMVAAVLGWWWRRRPALAISAAVALCVSLFLAPYAAPYDQAALLVGVAVLVAAIAPLSSARRALLLVATLITSPALGLLSAAGLIEPGVELLLPPPALAALLVVAERSAVRQGETWSR